MSRVSNLETYISNVLYFSYEENFKIKMEVLQVPNTKSAEKQLRASRRKELGNKAVHSRIKTEVKKFLAYIDTKDIMAAKSQIMTVSSILDKAAKKNIIHRNVASRKKSRLMRRLSLLEANLQAQA